MLLTYKGIKVKRTKQDLSFQLLMHCMKSNNMLPLKRKFVDMKKLLLIGALLCVFYSCGSGNGGGKKALTGAHESHEWVDLGLPSGLKWAI